MDNPELVPTGPLPPDVERKRLILEGRIEEHRYAADEHQRKAVELGWELYNLLHPGADRVVTREMWYRFEGQWRLFRPDEEELKGMSR